MDEFGGFDIETFMKEVDKFSNENERFQFLEEARIEEISTKKYSKNSMRRISSDLKCFYEWREARNCNREIQVPDKPLEAFSNDELNLWIPAFLAETRKRNGENYRARVIFEKAIVIQMHLHLHGRKVEFFSQPSFEPIKNAVDSIMRELQQIGLG